MTASQLLTKAQKDNNQRLILNVFTNTLYWFPYTEAEKGQLPSGKLEGPVFYMGPASDEVRFGAARRDIMEIGGLPQEVFVLHNHQLPYEVQFTTEDFVNAVNSAVRTRLIAA